MARRFKNRQKETEEPGINLTPLIDVVFCILIMFIVVAPLLELDRIQLADAGHNPADKVISVQEGGPICLHVHEDDSLWLNKRQVEMHQLAELLKQEKTRHPGVRPQLFQDKRAHFGTYQSVKNAFETAGFDQLDIILKPA